MPNYPVEITDAAKRLYLKRHKPKEISELLNVPLRTIYDWRTKGQWDDLLSHESVEEAMARRLCIIAGKEEKTKLDLDEIKNLTDSIVKLRASRMDPLKKESSGQEPGRPEKRRRKKQQKKKNDVSGITAADFKDKLHVNFFKYQMEMRAARHNRMRMYLKSRQIGATWYFAQEAFESAALECRNKIFLSATRAQSEVFRQYIVDIAKEHFGIELKGNPIELHTSQGTCRLYFLSNNSKSAQSYHGDVYIDEFFWIMKFNELYKVASGMAAHKKWRKTLFSTPSAVTHDAYDLWTGDRFNKRFKKKRVEFPGYKELQSGILCPDNSYRKIITLDDAEKGGCNLFDKKELKLEYSPAEYDNLFDCKFVDDTFSVFKFADLELCYTDILDWTDVDLKAPRPVGNFPVWGGYDPSRTCDDASFVVLLPPIRPGGKFRVIEKLKWVDKSFTWQAEEIKKLRVKYNFVHMGIDVTGPGLGVFEMVQKFFPQAEPIHYSIGNKTEMVLKAQEIIEANRLQWDANETTIAHAFLTIKKILTPGGQITYAASRTATTGHADVAWAIMHALSKEKIGHDGQSQCRVSIS